MVDHSSRQWAIAGPRSFPASGSGAAWKIRHGKNALETRRRGGRLGEFRTQVTLALCQSALGQPFPYVSPRLRVSALRLLFISLILPCLRGRFPKLQQYPASLPESAITERRSCRAELSAKLPARCTWCFDRRQPLTAPAANRDLHNLPFPRSAIDIELPQKQPW